MTQGEMGQGESRNDDLGNAEVGISECGPSRVSTLAFSPLKPIVRSFPVCCTRFASSSSFFFFFKDKVTYHTSPCSTFDVESCLMTWRSTSHTMRSSVSRFDCFLLALRLHHVRPSICAKPTFSFYNRLLTSRLSIQSPFHLHTSLLPCLWSEPNWYVWQPWRTTGVREQSYN